MKNGSGRLIKESGWVYNGIWKDNLKHGFGELTDTDGSCYDGQWNLD